MEWNLLGLQIKNNIIRKKIKQFIIYHQHLMHLAIIHHIFKINGSYGDLVVI